MRAVYECEKCHHEQQPVIKSDWDCLSCKRVIRTNNELPAGWVTLTRNTGRIVAFCATCSQMLGLAE